MSQAPAQPRGHTVVSVITPPNVAFSRRRPCGGLLRPNPVGRHPPAIPTDLLKTCHHKSFWYDYIKKIKAELALKQDVESFFGNLRLLRVVRGAERSLASQAFRLSLQFHEELLFTPQHPLIAARVSYGRLISDR